jgi:hypothetical protein
MLNERLMGESWEKAGRKLRKDGREQGKSREKSREKSRDFDDMGMTNMGMTNMGMTNMGIRGLADFSKNHPGGQFTGNFTLSGLAEEGNQVKIKPRKLE